MNTDKIVQAIKEQGLSLNGLAIKSEIAYSTLHDIVNRKAKNPRIDTVNKIANALKIPIYDLLISKEIENEKSDFESKEKENKQ